MVEQSITKLCPNCGAPMIGSSICDKCHTETAFGAEYVPEEQTLAEKILEKYDFGGLVDTFHLGFRVIGNSLDDFTLVITGRTFWGQDFTAHVRKEVLDTTDPSDIISVINRNQGGEITDIGPLIDNYRHQQAEHFSNYERPSLRMTKFQRLMFKAERGFWGVFDNLTGNRFVK